MFLYFFIHTYTQGDMKMQKLEIETKRMVYPVDLTGVEKDIEKICTKLGASKAEAIRESLKYYAEYVEGLEVVEYRNISKTKAKKEVAGYIKGKERVSADEVSDALRIDMSIVNEVLLELWQEGWVKPE